MNLNQKLEAGKQARKVQRELLGDRLRTALGMDKESSTWDIEEFDVEHHPIGDKHPGIAAVMYAREAISQFDIPSRVGLRYTSMKRKSGSGAHRLKDGVVWVEADFRSMSGNKHNIDIPIAVHDGHMVYPELFIHNGRPRVMAQSAFDEIIQGAETYRKLQDRKHMFMPGPSTDKPYEEEVPVVSTGLYGITAQLEEIPGAMGPDLEQPEMVGGDADYYLQEVVALINRAGPTPELTELLRAFQEKADAGTGKTAQRTLDEAERDRSDYCQPGEAITLGNDVTLKSRGGAMMTLKSGTKGTIIRDMFGTGDVYYVELENGCKAPINKGDIK